MYDGSLFQATRFRGDGSKNHEQENSEGGRKGG